MLMNYVISDEKCEECGAQTVNVVYKSDKTKFKDGSEEKSGCIFCSTDFTNLVEKHRAVASRPVNIRSGRGGTRGGRGGKPGRGGSGRGGRGGSRQPKDKMAQLDAYFV